MLLTTAIAIFLIAWSSIFLVDYVLRIRNFEPYIQLATRFGLEVSPFQLKFYVTQPHYEILDQNEHLLKRAQQKKKEGLLPYESESKNHSSKFRNILIKLWFGIGAFVSILCLIGITFYMTNILMKDVSRWMSTRPKVSTYYRGVEYRSMQNLLMATTMPTTTTELSKQENDYEMNRVIIVNDEEYDMIDDGQKGSGGIVPIIPGFNLPWSHIPIFMLVLIISAIIHELGHAWAAKSYGVDVNGFGIFVLAVYPGAFTDIEQVSLKRATSFRKLQIFGAGIWHNLLLAALGLTVFNMAPRLMSPILVEGRGVSVRSLDARSGLAGGTNGLNPGDIVQKIDECPVFTISDYKACIRAARNEHKGRCVDKEVVEAATALHTWTSNDEIHCCDEFNITNAHVCFKRVEKVVKMQTPAAQLNSLLGLKVKEKYEEEESVKITTKYSCLNARHVVQQPACNYTSFCEMSENEKICVYPALFNGTKLVKISLTNRATPVLFVGHLTEMLEMVSLSSYTPRFEVVSISWLEHFQLAAKYLFTLSLALGLINAMPCYALDGQFIVSTLLRCTGMSLRRQALIRYLLLTFGTSILVLNVIAGFFKLAFSSNKRMFFNN